MVLAILWAPLAVAGEPIALQDYLDRVRDEHPYFRAEALSVDVAERERDRIAGGEDWVVTADPALAYDDVVDPSFGAPDEIRSARFGAGVQRPVWATGGRIAAGYQYAFSDVTFGSGQPDLPGFDAVDFTGPDQFTRNGVSVTYRHPLLRNRGGSLDRLAYDLQGYVISQTTLGTLENREALLLDLGLGFLTWVQSTEEERIAGRRLELAQEELASTRRKREAGVVEEVDVVRAREAELEAVRNLRLIESRRMALVMGLAVQADMPDLGDRQPAYDLYALHVLPEPQAAVDRLREQSRVLQRFRERLGQLEREGIALASTERAELDLVVGAGLKDGDERHDDALGFDQPDATIALAYSRPWGNRSALAAGRRNLAEQEQARAQLADAARRLEARARSLLVELEALTGVLAVNREQIQTAAEQTREELRLYEQGRNELTFVIQSRDQEAFAQLLYARNAASYQALWLEWRATADDLLPAPLPPAASSP